jgi:signal transduction histidine kinase
MAAVSHELRTPLASIRMFAELLEEGRVEGADKRSRFMRLIISNCRRLSAMIENVLDLSRSERGLLRFEPEEIDLKGLLEDLFRDIRAVAEEEGFTMDIEIAPDLPAVRADPTALTRALFNLCDNARKYSGEAKHVRIRAAPEASGGAMIAITDSGPGIAAGEREKIFERFRRGREGHAAPTGAGLGLSLAREAVEGCGGRLELSSRKGEGATFTVYLPGLEEADE